jgi:hypothetical protein
MEQRAGLHVEVMVTRNWTPVSKNLASHCTDWAIAVHGLGNTISSDTICSEGFASIWLTARNCAQWALGPHAAARKLPQPSTVNV